MSYKSMYSGPQIDEALAKAAEIADQVNGWTKLPSTTDTPVNLNNVTNLGNYTVDNFTNGPSVSVTPLNVSVFALGGANRYQITHIGNDTYQRSYNRESSVWSKWTYVQSNTSTSIQPSAPADPGENTVWIDTTNPANPVFKIFIDGEWVEIRSPYMMDKTVYDPNSQATDIFAYIDNAIAGANMDAVQADFSSHTQDATIHVTATEKAAWNEKPTADMVNQSLQSLQSQMESNVISQAGNLAQNVNGLTVDVTDYQADLSEHTGNLNIHPDASKQAIWDGKAAGDHTHHLDGRVQVDASAVVSGIISADRIDPTAKERLVELDALAEMETLTTEDVQNGDMVYVKSPKLEIYYVVDDTKLGTAEYMQGFKLYSTGVTALTFENMEGKPTTVAGFGITDAYTKTEVDSRIDPLEQIVEQYGDQLTGIASFAGVNYSELYAAVQSASLRLESVKDTHAAMGTAMTQIMALTTELQTLLV